MKQRKNSARKDSNSVNRLWQRSLPAQTLFWLSLSLISNGLALAQTESAIDNIVPTAETAPKRVENFVPKAKVTESSQVEFSSRRTRLRQRLKRNVASQPVGRLRQSQKNTQQATVPVVRKLRPKIAESRESRIEKSQVEVTSQPTAPIREEKPQNQPQVEIKAPIATTAPSKLPTLAQPNKPININGNTADKPKDYNNAYIDPTDYSTANGNRNESPTGVILTERSSGCRSVIGKSQNISGNCVKTPVNDSLAERLATSKRGTPSESLRTTAPSWIRKSHSINVANTAAATRIAATAENNSGWRASRIAAASKVPVAEVIRNATYQSRDVTRNINRTIPLATSIVASSNKNTYHPNRFIPAPSSFVPQQTTLSETPAPSAGSLPLPMTSVNVAPRPSTVAYNIPLESTLPRVTYTGGFAQNPTGFIFPVSVPSPITSIFGWRTHPITGDRRFHSGTDIGAAMGTPVLAAYTGQIEVADFVGGYGLTVIVNHNSAVQTLYGHMSQVYVQPGQWVQQGTVIGLVGSTGNSTGPHLHFEVRQLTQNGWVATDPNVHLQYALAQLMQSLQTAQLPQVPQ